VTNNYGVYVENQTAGTNRWNLWSGPASFHADLWGTAATNVLGTTRTDGVGGAFLAEGSGAILGGVFQARSTASNVGSYGAGAEIYLAHTTGTTTEAAALFTGLFVNGTGGVTTDGSGLLIGSNAVSAGTLTNNYGLLVRNQTAGTNNWAIKTGTGLVEFGGNLKFTAPATITNSTAVLTLPVSTDTLVGRSTSDTLTNKTLDVEGTGNTLNTVGVVWIDGAGCDNTDALKNWDKLASGGAVETCDLGTNTAKGVLRFATDSGTLSAQRKFLLPHDWDSGRNIDARIKWKTGATTGDVVWQAAIACAGDGDSDDPAFTDTVFAEDTAQGTASRINDTAVTTVATTGACAPSDVAFLRVRRDPAHASDTLAAGTNADLIGLEIRYRRAQ